jgi:predicted nucleotide kinase in modified base biosynthesis
MTRSVYLIGPPGVGKTTSLIHALRLAHLDLAGSDTLDARWPLLSGHRILRAGIPGGVLLGRCRPRHGGTDALSMAVSPQATAWAAEGRLPRLIVGEGQRLANTTFLGALAARSDLTVAVLDADDDALDARRNARGSNQDPAWMRGARTKARNLAGLAAEAGWNVERLDTTPFDRTYVAGWLTNLLIS